MEKIVNILFIGIFVLFIYWIATTEPVLPEWDHDYCNRYMAVHVFDPVPIECEKFFLPEFVSGN